MSSENGNIDTNNKIVALGSGAAATVKILWLMISGAFIFGAWSSTLELRSQDHSEMITSHSERISSFEKQYQSDQRTLIDILGRMDERLKNIERK